jgi:hypothetical protein
MEYKRAVELVSKTLGQPFDRTEFNKLANQILKTAETKDSTTSNAGKR